MFTSIPHKNAEEEEIQEEARIYHKTIRNIHSKGDQKVEGTVFVGNGQKYFFFLPHLLPRLPQILLATP